LASPAYKGEILLTLRGHVVSERKDPLPDADVVLVWPDYSGARPTFAGVRVPVESELGGRFTLSLFVPPPDAAYDARLTEIWGTRFASASLVVAERGVAIDGTDNGVLARVDGYVLTYAEGNGEVHGKTPDGGDGVLRIPKGFRLVRQDTIICADGFDQACYDAAIANGEPDFIAQSHCIINGRSITHPVGVPLDTELTVTVIDRDAPPKPRDYTIPCP
jgi:hypothetical protein